MSKISTGLGMQRVTFVESLHSSLKKQATRAIADYKRFVTLASSYINDGLEDGECIELLMIDGLSRDAAESYTTMAQSKEAESHEDLDEYSFQFEDEFGKVWSSYDIGRTIRASNDEEAWVRAEEVMNSESDTEPQKLLSVHRID